MSTFNLKLSTGPVLTYHRPGEPVEEVTDRAYEFLNAPFQADEGVTLNDYLALLGTSPLLQAVYSRDFAESIFLEAQKGPLAQDPEDAIEYLELYFHWHLDSLTKTYSRFHRMHLHGIGVVLQKDREEYNCKAGERITWGVSATPLRELLSIPVRINHEVLVLEADPDAYAEGQEIQRVRIDTTTLGQALHGLLWELSFHGTPAQAQEKWAEIHNDLEDYKAGKGGVCEVTTGSIFEELGLPVPAGIALMFETIGAQNPWQLECWLREIPDQDLALDAIARKFQGEVVVKREYRELMGYAFRRMFRLADEAAV